jgi:predicted dehydrogenase
MCVALEGDVQGISIESEEPLTIELKAFLDSIKNRSKPLADGQAGYEALKVVEACYESSQKGRRIEIEWK